MNKKIIFSIIAIVVLVIGLVVGFFLVKQQQDLRKKASPSTSLTLSANNSSPKVGENFSVVVSADTGSNQISGIEIHLTFDSSKLRATNVSAGNFFVDPQILGPSIDNATGTIFYTLNLPLGVIAQTGTGTIATVTFEALATGNASIGFSEDTFAVAEGENDTNVIQSKNNTAVTVLAATNATATPTASPSPTPLATASPSPTATATATSSPTASPTPTSGVGGVSTPTPTPVKTKSPTPQATATPMVETLPDSGIPMPTVIFGGGALILLFLGAFLIL